MWAKEALTGSEQTVAVVVRICDHVTMSVIRHECISPAMQCRRLKEVFFPLVIW
jgi:hypothetical protein